MECYLQILHIVSKQYCLFRQCQEAVSEASSLSTQVADSIEGETTGIEKASSAQ